MSVREVAMDRLDELTNEIEQGFMQRGGWKSCRYALGQFTARLLTEAAPKTTWYTAEEVSREIWDGDIWWWDNDDQIFPVNISWCPMDEYFFACVGQWGWNRPQKLTDMGGKWSPCIEPDRQGEQNHE